MTNFAYTHFTNTPGSSLVRAVAFNSQTKELAVNLNGEIYVYSGTSYGDYTDIAHAHSKGQAYNAFQNRHPSHAQHIGKAVEVNFLLGLSAVAAEEQAAEIEAVPVVGKDQAVIYELRPVVETKTAPVTEAKRSHTVFFTLGDDPKEFGYNVDGATVDEAVAAISEVGAALDQKFTALRVVTHLV